MDIRKARALLGAGVLVAAGLAAVATPTANATPSSVSTHHKVAVSAAVEWDGWCTNKGPVIQVNTETLFGDSVVQVSFWNSQKGQKQLSLAGAVELVGADGEHTITVQKAPTAEDIGVGGNPFIYYDGPEEAAEGGTDPDRVYIGRCVQDGKIGQELHGRWSSDFDVDALTTLTLQSLSCTKNGSNIHVDADTSTEGVGARLLFSNSDLSLNPQHVEDPEITGSWEFALANGMDTHKGWGAGGAGGNPIIHTDTGTWEEGTVNSSGVGTFVSGDGVQDDHGRCNKLA